MDANYEPLPSHAEAGEAPPDALLGSESEQWQWEAIPNLDQFFTRIYRYWEGKGFVVMLTSRVLNLLALAFTAAMSALLLLYVDWGALRAQCLKDDTCDIWEAAVRKHPLSGGLTPWTALAVAYLALFGAYWLFALAHLAHDVRELREVKRFCNQRLGLSERQLGVAAWPEVARRLVEVQRRHRLCVSRELGEHDIVARVMRRENYLVGMLNKGVLALNVPIPGLRRHLLLTKTLEWNLYWCVLDAMHDDHFRLKPGFLRDAPGLRRRLRLAAALNAAAAPFLLVFLLTYFFMKNAERFYHHPSSVGARRWSPLAAWRLREFNELPHFVRHRLDASHAAAEAYIRQFPSPVVSHVARFVAFVAGSAAALLLVVTLIDERLLERDLFGRQLVWWVAVVGVVLAASRAFVAEAGTAFDPEAAMMEVVAHTHYLPRHWRGRAHTLEVQREFEALFQFKALLFLEELASVALTPLLLAFSLPQCAGAVLAFVERNTATVEGVGDVCSLAAFDFQRHGNARYGAPADAPPAARSRQGKLEKSFLSFAATYPAWEPDAAGQQLLARLGEARPPAPPPARLWPAGAPPPGAAALAAALAARGYGGARAAAAAGPASSIFASAELMGVAADGGGGGVPAGAASLAGPASEAAPPDERLQASQLLLQSLYEQRSSLQHPLQPQPAPPQPAPPPPAWPPPQHQQQQPPVQQWPPQQSPQERREERAPPQLQPARPPAAPSPRAGLPSPGTSLPQRPPPQQPLLAGSPGRQGWLSRSPSGRTRVAELSVLSRENSSAGAASPAAADAAPAAPRGMPVPPAPAPAPAVAASPAASPPDAEWLLHQQLLHGGGLHSSDELDGGGGGSPGSDGPPDFF